MFCVTDCSLLSLDSSREVASLVGKCGRPAALVCVYALETDSFLSANTWTNTVVLRTVHGPIRGLPNLVLMTAA